MEKNRILRFFYPSDEVIKTLSEREASHLPFLVSGTSIFALLIATFGIMLAAFGKGAIGLAALLVFFLFTVGLIFIKRGRVKAGGMVSTICIFLMALAVTFFASQTDSEFAIYRASFMIVVMSVYNLLIAIDKKQVYVFIICTVVLWIVYSFTICRGYFAAVLMETIMVYSISLIGIVSANVAIVLSNKFNDIVLTKSDAQKKAATQALSKITKVLDESKAGLNIGNSLTSSADTASAGITNINEVYQYIMSGTDSLSMETSSAEAAGTQVLQNAEKMQNSVENLHASITETSAAITQISANISNVTSIAAKRKEGMDQIVVGLDSQGRLTEGLVHQVERLQESSAKIAEFVTTVNKIASQTGLLAMNASIEAAHAGTLGKGFSVIAHEIRKLSEETTTNANNIEDTLKANGEIVHATAEAVTDFARLTKTSISEIKTTILGIEEIIAGISEMDLGTQEVMRAMNSFVDEASITSDLVSGVTKEINEQSSSLTNIAEITNQLKEKVGNLEVQIDDINSAIRIIQSEAQENVVVSEKIASSLDSI